MVHDSIGSHWDRNVVSTCPPSSEVVASVVVLVAMVSSVCCSICLSVASIDVGV